MSGIGDLWFALRADGRQLSGDITKEGEKAGTGFASRFKSAFGAQNVSKSVIQGAGIGGGLLAFTALSTAIGGVVSVMSDAVGAAIADEASVQKLGTALKANIAGWDGNTDAIERTLAARMELGFSDDEQRDSLALLVASTHDVNKALEVQRTAMDLARLKGISLADASNALIKVEGGQYRMLKQLGIQLPANATAEQALAAVQRVSAGQAEDYANTTGGKLLVAQVKFGEVMENLGRAILPALTGALGAVADAAMAVGSALAQAGVGVAQTFDTAAAAAANGSESARLHLAAMKKVAADTANGWDASTNKIVTSTEHMRGGITQEFHKASSSASAIANALPGIIAKDLRGGYNAIDSASKALGEAMKNPIKAAAREKALTDVLDGKGSAGKRLLAGLRSADPVVRQAAIDLKKAVVEELAAIRNVGVTITATLSLKGGFKGGARAGGGPVAPNGIYRINERGPETLVMYPGGGGYVIPAHGSAASSYASSSASSAVQAPGRARVDIGLTPEAAAALKTVGYDERRVAGFLVDASGLVTDLQQLTAMK